MRTPCRRAFDRAPAGGPTRTSTTSPPARATPTSAASGWAKNHQCGWRSRTIVLALVEQLRGRTARRQRRTWRFEDPRQAQPSSSRRSSSMPKWWATSWTTVMRTCSTTSSSSAQHGQDREAEDGDAVGHHHAVVALAPRGERDAVVVAEEVRRRARRRAPARPRCPSAEPRRLGDPVERLARPGPRSDLGRRRPPAAAYEVRHYPRPAMDAEALLEGLDEAQRRAVTSTAMPLVVLAPGRVGQDPGAHPPHRPPRRHRGRRPATSLRPHLHPQGGRRAHRPPRARSASGRCHRGHLPRAWPGVACASRGRSRAARPHRSSTARAGCWRRWLPRWRRRRAASRGRRPGHGDRVGQGPDDHPRQLRGSGGRGRPAPAASKPELVAEAYRRLRAPQAAHRAGRLRRPARAVRPGPRGGRPVRGGPAVALPATSTSTSCRTSTRLQFRLLEAWRGDGYDITARGRSAAGHLRVERRRRPFLLDIHATGRRPRSSSSTAATGRRRRSSRPPPPVLTRRQAARPGRAGRSSRRASPPSVVGPRHRPVRGRRDRAAVRSRTPRAVRWADQAILVRTHAQASLLAEALREGGHPPPGPGRHQVPRASRRAAGPARRGPAQSRPLGTALADLEPGLEDDPAPAAAIGALGRPRPRRPRRPGRGGRRQAAGRARRGGPRLLRMGRDYLRLDPVGGGSAVRDLAGRHRPIGVRGLAGAGDAVDVATFHAAKGLEWAIVHLGRHRGRATCRSRTPQTPASARGGPPAVRGDDASAAGAADQLGRAAHVRGQGASSAAARRCSPRPRPARVAGDPVDRRRAARGRLGRRAGPPAGHARPRRSAASPELQSLRRWRDTVARAARVEPEAVLADRVLARIVTTDPHDLAALGAVRGVGDDPRRPARRRPPRCPAPTGRGGRDEVHRRPAVP